MESTLARCAANAQHGSRRMFDLHNELVVVGPAVRAGVHADLEKLARLQQAVRVGVTENSADVSNITDCLASL